MSLLEQIRRFIGRYSLFVPGDAIIVGVSGGPDSLCLLHLLHRLAPDMALRLHVAHLNHGLRGADADADASFVADVAEAWGLPATIERVDVAELARVTGQGVEEAARTARYTFLAKVAEHAGARVVAVGHNADDQAETVLMHFLRGGGLAGLHGMQPASDFGFWTRSAELGSGAVSGLTLVRPLLSVTRADVVDYCAQHGLAPRFDRSNEDTTFYRNRLRHELLPVLETYNPQIRRILGSSATVLSGDYELLREHLVEIWPQVVVNESDARVVADLTRFRRLPASLQRSLLREAAYRLRRSLRDVGFVHVENALWLVREGHAGDRMTLPAGLEVVLGSFHLAIGDAGLDLAAGDRPQLLKPCPLAVPGVLRLNGWSVEASLLSPAELPHAWHVNPDPWQAWLDADWLGLAPCLRTRAGGERFRPLGLAGHSKSLAEYFTNAKVPAAARDRWPLLVTSDDQIAWVCGLRVDERAKVTASTQRVLYLVFRRQVGP